MISKSAYNYCKDDVSLIENYHLAINDKTQKWDCHHRLETDKNVSKQYLIDNDLYLNRPASELIFLTHAEHTKLHKKGTHHSEETKKKQSDAQKGEKSYMYGKHHSEETKQKIKDHTDIFGEKNPMYGKHYPWMNNGIIRVRPKNLEEIDHYLKLGYYFGMKLK